MESPTKREATLGALKKLMAAQIKLDIASTIRHHPHMTGESSQKAYRTLANDETVDELVRQLAKEEVEAAVTRGEIPAASFLLLAGYNQNVIGEG
jgi:hypothetical protein